MLNFDFTYDVINLLLLGMMIYVGKLVSKGKSYWKPCAWIIIMFTFVEGARYGRGVDYLHYIDVYNYDLEKEQVLFTFINRVLKSLGISAEQAFFFYAFPFVLGAMYFMKPMRKYATYLFPLFLISFIGFHEIFIRQALSFSFIFIYMGKLNNIIESFPHKKIKVVQWAELFLLAVIAYSIHSIAIVGIFVSTLAMIFLWKPFPWIITVPILLIGKFYVSQHFDFSYLNSLLQFLGSTNEKFSDYTENADKWFSQDAINEAYTRNVVIQFLEAFACCSLAYLGNKLLLRSSESHTDSPRQQVSISLGGHYKLYVALFNISIIGLVILETFYNLEIVRRVSYCWELFWFVPVAIILYYRKSKIFNTLDRFLMLGFLYWAWQYIRFLFVWQDVPMFVWDKI